MSIFKHTSKQPLEPRKQSASEFQTTNLLRQRDDGHLDLDAARLELRLLRQADPLDPGLEKLEEFIRQSETIYGLMESPADEPTDQAPGARLPSAAAVALDQLRNAKAHRRVHPDAAWIAYVGITFKDPNDPALGALKAFAYDCMPTKNVTEIRRRCTLAFSMTGIPAEDWVDHVSRGTLLPVSRFPKGSAAHLEVRDPKSQEAQRSGAALSLHRLKEAKAKHRMHPDAPWISYVDITTKNPSDPALGELRAFAEEGLDRFSSVKLQRRGKLASSIAGTPPEEWIDPDLLSRALQREADARERTTGTRLTVEESRVKRGRELIAIGKLERAANAELRERQLKKEKRRRKKEKRQRKEQDRLRAARWLNRPSPKPEPQPFGVSHRGAESLVCAWMRHLGVLDAEVTQFVGDGGIDVSSSDFIAQVKNYAGSIPVAAVREVFGVAVADSKHPLLFTSGTMTVEGNAFASRVGMAVFRYNAEEGTLEGLNAKGAKAVEFSLPDAFRS